MRAIWKGSITFGLVNVPISVLSATESHDVRLHQVHSADGGRIRYQRRCEVCGEVVEWAEIDKAFADGDRTVVLTDDELSELPTEKSREIEILQFVPSEQIDPIMFAKSYYLAPTSSSPKSYALLLRTLEETERTAVVSFTLRQRTQLAALRVRDGVMLLQTLLWADEVREPDFSVDDVRVSAKELEMSAALVENFSADFDPTEYTDEYQEQLRTLVEAKLEQGDAVDTEVTLGKAEETEEAEVLDLMEALRRSVSDAKKRKSGGGSGSGSSSSDGESSEAKRAPAKKPAARKPAAKKPAAKSGTTAAKTGTAAKNGTAAKKKTASKKTA